MNDESSKMNREALRGWGGQSPRYWAAALELQDQRLVDAYKTLSEIDRESDEWSEAFRRLHLEARFLLIAFGHMLRSLRVCAEVLGDDEIKSIRDDFDKRAPWVKHFRDVLEHLDEYTTGGGRLRAKGELGAEAGPVLMFTPGGRPYEVIYHLGTWKLPLRAAAEAGSALGHKLAEAWERKFGPEPQLLIWGRSK